MRYTRREFSSPDEVVAVLEQMRTAREDLCLQGNDQDTWIIMSYDPESQRYYVSTSLPADRPDYMEVFDPARPHRAVDAVIGGQLVSSWEDSLVGFEAAKAAFSHFFGHQARHPGLSWRIAKIC